MGRKTTAYEAEKARGRAKSWYYENREAVLATRKLSSKSESLRLQRKRLRQKWKAMLFEVLGDKCSRCGFTDQRAVQVDHINGGGNRIRTNNSRCTTSYYRVLAIDPETPKHFQLLCANCNWIKRYENDELHLAEQNAGAKF